MGLVTANAFKPGIGVLGAVALLWSVVLSGSISSAEADEGEARAMFVRAEMLRRSDVCEAPKRLRVPENLSLSIAIAHLSGEPKIRQLRPVLPALTNRDKLDARERLDLLACLERYEEAAVLEERIMKQHPASEVAYDLASERRLTSDDVAELITETRSKFAEHLEPERRAYAGTATGSSDAGDANADEIILDILEGDREPAADEDGSDWPKPGAKPEFPRSGC